MRSSGALSFLVMVILLTARPGVALGEEERPRRVEWIIDGALTVGWLAMLPSVFYETTTEARIGPRVRGPEDVVALETALAQGLIDRSYREDETISDAALVPIIASISLGSLAIGYGIAPWIDSGDQDGRWFGEQILNATIGMIHALFGTYMLTSVAKITSGRLRPDFADRADRYYCYQEPVHEAYRSRCRALEAANELGPEVEEDEVVRGRRSFWSGHASMSFAAATYATLIIGGRMVWGERSTALTRIIGIILQTTSMMSAAFVAGSRVSDGVHHIEDVLVGAAVGITTACLGYFLHFDMSGEVRRGVLLSVGPREDGVIVGLAGAF